MNGLVAAVPPGMMLIGKYPVDVVSLFFAMVAVIAVRILVGFKDRSATTIRREMAHTVIAAVFVLAYVVERSPGPGLAVLIGAGVGISIATLIAVVGDWIVLKVRTSLGTGDKP